MALTRIAASISLSGSVLWSDRPGWSASRSGTGVYQVTFPTSFSSANAYGVMCSPIWTDGGDYGTTLAVATPYDPQPNSIRVATRTTSQNTITDCAFTIEVIGGVKDPEPPPVFDMSYGVELFRFIHNVTTFLYRSNPDATLGTVNVGRANIYPRGQGITLSRYGAITGGAFGASSITQRINPSWSALLPSAGDKYRSNTYSGNILTNIPTLMYNITDKENDTASSKQQFAHFDIAGAVLWEQTPGWSCTNGNGTYTVTYPAGLTVESDCITASCVSAFTNSGQEFTAVVGNHNEANRTFQVNTYADSITTPSGCGFSIMMVTK